MIALYFIVAMFTGSDDRKDAYIFNNPSFYTRTECVKYVKTNFSGLNLYVNEEYNAEWDNPNLFFCLNKKEIRDLKNGSRKKQLITS